MACHGRHVSVVVGGHVVSVRDNTARLQLGEDLGEEAGLGVDAQHAARQPVDDVQAAVPELVLGVLDEERLEGVGDLVAHVGVREVEAGQDDRLQILLVLDILFDQLADQHVDKDYVGRIDECHVLETKRLLRLLLLIELSRKGVCEF